MSHSQEAAPAVSGGSRLPERPMHDSEEQLIARCLQGDASAWEEIYRLHYGRVKQVIGWRRWGFTPIEVEDGVQEVFLQLVRSLPGFRGEASLATFLTRLARNRCISHLRRKTARKRGKEELSYSLDGERDEGMPFAPAIDPDPGPEGSLLLAEEGRDVARALEALSPECRQVLHLRYYKQLSYKEICSALSLPLGTVCSRLKRCLLRLRSGLAPCASAVGSCSGDPEA